MEPSRAGEPSPATVAAREMLACLGLPGRAAQITVTVHGPDGPLTVHLSA